MERLCPTAFGELNPNEDFTSGSNEVDLTDFPVLLPGSVLDFRALPPDMERFDHDRMSTFFLFFFLLWNLSSFCLYFSSRGLA